MTEYVISRSWKNCDKKTIHTRAEGDKCTLGLFAHVLIHYFYVAGKITYETLHFKCSQKKLPGITKIIRFLGYSDPELIESIMGYDNPVIAKIEKN